MKCTPFAVLFLVSLLPRVRTAPVEDDPADGVLSHQDQAPDRRRDFLGFFDPDEPHFDEWPQGHILLTGACFMSSAPGQPQAPCAAVQNVGAACAAAGSSPAALQAYGQCLCQGSFFANWLACLGCLRAEGSTSDRDGGFFASAVTNVSSIFCGPTATPTPAPAPAPVPPPAPVFTSTYTTTYTSTVGANVVTVTTVVIETTSTTVTPTTSSTTSTTTTTASTISTTTTTTTPTTTSTSTLTSSTTDTTTSDSMTSDPLTPDTATSDTATSDSETLDSASTDPTPTDARRIVIGD